MKEEYLLTGPLEPTNRSYAVAKIAGIKDLHKVIQPSNTGTPLFGGDADEPLWPETTSISRTPT